MAQVRRSVSEALWAMSAADSMSMPVHWYYDTSDIKRDFGGWISGFKSPKDKHPSSILSLSNTSKKSLWWMFKVPKNAHNLWLYIFFLFVFKLAAVGQPGRRAANGLMWSVMWSSMISWTCGSPPKAQSTIIEVPLTFFPHWSINYVITKYLLCIFICSL